MHIQLKWSNQLKCPQCKSLHNNVYYVCPEPLRYQYICNCGFELRYDKRRSPNDIITQEELDNECKKQFNNKINRSRELYDAMRRAKGDVIKAKAEYPY